MSRYDTEDEQLAAFKAWWKKNGTKLLSSVLIVALAFSAWRYWTNTKWVEATNASTMFEMLQGNMQQGTFAEVSREALKLIQEQPKSPYAASAAMLYATYSLEKGEADEAIQHLTWVFETATDAQLRHLALLRVARIQLDTQAFVEAESNLASLSLASLNDTEKANVDYISGLVALAQNKQESAYSAFSAVVANRDAEKSLIGLAQIQLDDLSQ